jgi:hypothetical protein
MGDRPSPRVRLVAMIVVVMAVTRLLASPPPPPPSPSFAIHGDRFQVNGQDTFLIFVSYFDAMRANAATLNADLTYIRDTLHLDGIRIFPNWWDDTCAQRRCFQRDTLMSAGESLRAGRLDQLRLILNAARRRHLFVDISFARDPVCDDTPSPALGHCVHSLSVAHYKTQLRDTLHALEAEGRFNQVLIDLQNERDLDDARHLNQFLPADDVRDLVKSVNTQWMVMASTTETSGVTGTATLVADQAGPLDVAAYHDPRHGDWSGNTRTVVQDLRKALDGLTRTARVPIYLQEPSQWQQDAANPAHFTAAIKNARAAGAAAWTFHTRSGYILGGSHSFKANIEADPAQRDVILGLRAAADSGAR